MAYNIDCVCDCCGVARLCWLNVTVSYTSTVAVARSSGGKVTKNGWICPDCVRRIKEEKKCRKSQSYII